MDSTVAGAGNWPIVALQASPAPVSNRRRRRRPHGPSGQGGVARGHRGPRGRRGGGDHGARLAWEERERRWRGSE